MLNSLRPQHRAPFIAGCAALMILGIILAPVVNRSVADHGGAQIIMGIILGALGSVVLYGVMRALSRPE